jgi:hypothetical protein
MSVASYTLIHSWRRGRWSPAGEGQYQFALADAVMGMLQNPHRQRSRRCLQPGLRIHCSRRLLPISGGRCEAHYLASLTPETIDVFSDRHQVARYLAPGLI